MQPDYLKLPKIWEFNARLNGIKSWAIIKKLIKSTLRDKKMQLGFKKF